MHRILAKYIDKLFFKTWIIGICRNDIKDIIRSKTFDPDINWLLFKSFDKFYADPFLLSSKDGNFKIIFEDYTFDDDYGRISLMTLDKSFRQVNHKILLDTKSHLSYPFVFTENNKTYVFPEAGKSGKLSCYEYDPGHESLEFLQDILDLPLLDSTILKHDDKYWIFGALSENGTDYKLYVYFSDSLLGPYVPHHGNPIKSGLNGTRSAGNFIEVDGIIFRPTQNCKKKYGESITINKVTELNEINVVEEPYLTICINKKKRENYRMHKIHTINVMDNIIVVDGGHWTFSPVHQFKKFVISILKSYRLRKTKEKIIQ
jgi:hypothetical protein